MISSSSGEELAHHVKNDWTSVLYLVHFRQDTQRKPHVFTAFRQIVRDHHSAARGWPFGCDRADRRIGIAQNMAPICRYDPGDSGFITQKLTVLELQDGHLGEKRCPVLYGNCLRSAPWMRMLYRPEGNPNTPPVLTTGCRIMAPADNAIKVVQHEQNRLASCGQPIELAQAQQETRPMHIYGIVEILTLPPDP